jgi:dynein heavy chain
MKRSNSDAEFKTIGGQNQLVTRKASLSRPASLPSLHGKKADGPDLRRPSSVVDGALLQRGILSEVVRRHDGGEITACQLGPLNAKGSKHEMRKSPSGGNFSLSEALRSKCSLSKPVEGRPSTTMVKPKVIEVYNHKPGDAPRKVTVERRRKWYNSLDIEELLVARNISFRNPSWNEGFWLQLEEFDNTEFDIRDIPGWMRMGFQEAGPFLPIRALGLRMDPETGTGIWEACIAHKYDANNRRILVMWCSDMEPGEKASRGSVTDMTPLSRLQVLFNGEDPELFADRLQFAFECLRAAQNRAKFNFFIDNMPTDDIQGLDVDQVARIMELSRNMAPLREASLEQFANELVKEVNLDFARTMNKITFIHQHNERTFQSQDETSSKAADKATPDARTGESFLANVEIPEEEDPFSAPSPWMALWPVPEYNFVQTFSSFCFSSLYIKTEVVSTLCSVTEECGWLLDQCVYLVQFPKAMRLDQYKQMQKSAISQTVHKIKDSWVTNLQKIILKNFENVGKGWFSIHETNQETYRQGKMKKLLTIVRFVMQDSMRSFTIDSVKKYCEVLQGYGPEEVIVNNLLDVESLWPGKDGEQKRKKGLTTESGGEKVEGLFLLELKKSENGENFQYSTSGELALKVIEEVLELGLASLNDVSQLEKSIVPQLFRTVVYKQVLSCVGTDEDWVKDHLTNLVSYLAKSLPCLDEYLKLFEPHKSLLALDPVKVVEAHNIEGQESSAEEIRADILSNIEKEEQILAAIPESLTLGLFEVSCAEIRKFLANKHRKIVELGFELLTQRFRLTAEDVISNFSGILSTLRKTPKDVETSTEMRDYMQTVPGECVKQSVEINKCIRMYDILEEFKVRVTNDDTYQRWRVFGCPKQAYSLMEEVEAAIQELEAQFFQQMQNDQVEFDESLADLGGIIEGFAQYHDLEKIKEIYDNVESVNERLKAAASQSKLFNSREVLFGKEQTDYSLLQGLTKEWEPFSQLWSITYNWMKDSKEWLNGPFDQIDAKYCESSVFSGVKQLFKTVKVLTTREDTAEVLKIAEEMKRQMDDFQPNVPLVVGLRNKGMRERHWEQVSEFAKTTVNPEMEDFTLQKFIELGLVENATNLAELGDRAGKELNIENQLHAMMKAWEPIHFDLSEMYRTTETYILKGDGEVMALLDEQIVVTQAMQFSPFNKPFKEEIDEWGDKLLYVSECLDWWLKVQRAWMYLQPIFDSPDIMKQLPVEGKKFKSVDNQWRQVMNRVHNHSHALTACSQEGLKEKWEQANNDLELVQKGLEEYLETKRGAFARFYFLSNDELLEILSQTKDPVRVQPFLCKVFEAMMKVTFLEDLSISEMHSKEGESIGFVENVITKNKNVEVWMTDLEAGMCNAVRQVMLVGVETYPNEVRTEWVLHNAGQIVLNASQVHWTAEVEQSLDDGAVQQYFEKLADQLMGLVRLVRGKVTKLQRTSIGALVVIDVHAKDVVEMMAREKVEESTAFEWISQLRYYWEEDDRGAENCWVRMVQTSFPYGYEYLGNSFRLVITPLTDMCYMTLMGAQSLNLGGAPAGPAGTGKTESTKDLAKALAKQCVVFNCSPEMDYLMVGKFFKGLSSSGAWCCFDEFNRIYIEVLSVIAQQLLVLFGAKSELTSYNDQKELEFEGAMIVMKPTFNVFITMNPGYAGRAELPDNLAALFRPMAMMVPDYALIGEIMFYAFGFEDGRPLAKKMVTTFKLCSEQLSSQDHYDYGMRAVKTVIEAAGLNKQKYPDQQEAQILLRALLDVNVPKFLKDDLPLYDNIMSDLFPGVSKPEIDYGSLEDQIRAQSKKFNLQDIEYFVEKNYQLFDMIQVRHGMMLVGPTGGGKTCCQKTLQRACTALFDPKDVESPYQKVHIHCLNPKAITQNQLYGNFDPVTHEWQDGIAAEEIRLGARDKANPDHHWIMFDGPVDALWIESMNTVLDDNKKLCLVSGEIISLTPQMRMQFEVEDLAVASPATVSRCGMIYMEPGSLGIEPLVDSWIERLPETFSFQPQYAELLKKMYLDFLKPTLFFVKKRLKEVVVCADGNLTNSMFKFMDCYFSPFIPTELKPAANFKGEIGEIENKLKPLFIFCMLWTLGGSCDGATKPMFSDWCWVSVTKDKEWREKILKQAIYEEMKLPPEYDDIPMEGVETGDNLYNYCFSWQEERWIPWLETKPKYEVPRSAKYEDIVVPSVDSVRMMFAFSTLVEQDKHCLCPGPTGTGKSTNIALYLQKQCPDNFQSIFVSFSAQTFVNTFQDLIDSKLEKRRRGVYGPPAGKKMVLFVDDLNMPQKEYYGAQPPIELLRQWHDHRGWYNRKELKAFEIVDMIMVSAMGPPGGGRTFITDRLTRHYNVLSYADFMAESITEMFTVMNTYFFATFDESVQKLIPTMISSIGAVFSKAQEDLLPTPAKSHYLFNLRDIWRVFLGVCSLKQKKANNPLTVLRCWCHEIYRVFGDRLTDQPDCKWMDEIVREKVTEDFKMDANEIFASERLVFASFMTVEIDNRCYEEVNDMQKMKEQIEEYLDDYNNTFAIQMPLVMFLDACSHCARISRVLEQPNGNVLLLGVGGSGRQSLARLASAIYEYQCFQIEVAKGYGNNEFKEDLKTCLMRAGVEQKVQVFLFCDAQIVKEDFVEAVNNVLNSGDVPNLYKQEDMDTISQACRSICQAMGMAPTKSNIFAAYLTRVKKNVHVILAFSPVGDSFRNRLRMFPSLVNCCTIDWFHEWPAEALYSVAKQQLGASDAVAQMDQVEPALQMFKVIHQTVEKSAKKFLKVTKRQVYVTPTSYLELLSAFVTILQIKQKQVGTQQHRYQVGLDKIMAAEEQVSGLQEMLVEKKPALEQTQKEVSEMMVVIEKDKADAAVVQTAVAKEEAEANIKASETQAIKDDAQKDLDEALPALDQAVQCLKRLKADHIREVKALANPPAGVRLAMEGVCIMFAIKPVKKNDPNTPGKKIDDYWESSQKELLSDPKKLLEMLFNFDKDNIPEKVIATIAPYMEREDFDPAAIKKASIACEAVCMWCRAMFKYYHVAKAVEPKRACLRGAEAELKEVMERLQEAQSKLAAVNAKIQKLQSEFDAAVAKQTELQDDMNLCEVKLERAHKLIGGLGGEKARWGETVKRLTQELKLLPGDCLVAAGMVSYSGPFTAEYRAEFESYWREKLVECEMPHNEGTSMKAVLGEPVQIQQWVVWALPNDGLSIENAIIIDRSRRWPLMIDPQRQANKYIKNMGKDYELGLDVIKLSEANFLRTLELAIQFGKWVLLENIGIDLDPALEPILLQQKVKDGSGFTIKLGDKSVSYMDTFKFFLTTTLPNPHYSPETQVKITLLNFAITPEGLEDQMLGIVVAKERPDLEEQKNQLVVQNAKMNKQLKDIEDEILRLLATSEGDVLEDDTLVNTITASKQVAGEINEKQEAAKITEVEIDEARESYRPVAYRASVLFFCIVELPKLDPMYAFSLQWFQLLFSMSIDSSAKADDVEQRLVILKDYFTEQLYQNICRGLFEKDKLLFSFLLCLKILIGDKQIDLSELRFLLTGPTSDLTEHGPPIPVEWLGKASWNEILTVAQLPAFEGFDSYFSEHVDEFKAIYDSVQADKAPLPEKWQHLTSLEHMCFLRTMRLDCLTATILQFVTDKIGQKFVEPPTFDIAKSFADSTNITPLIFILSPGTDPVADVLAFADKMNMGKRFESISLGQGQGPKAKKMIEMGQGIGGWVLLSNCHLAESWMPSLEAITESFSPETIANNFRLWLTSMPALCFPVLILQNGVKMTNQPPSGLRANLLRSYSQITDKLFTESEKPEAFKNLLFGFCFFHAVAQDRRKFGPIGWNIQYGFTPEDLQVCRRQLMVFINQYEEVPYKVLNYLGAAINYGGRVTDKEDKRLIGKILNTYIHPLAIELKSEYKYSSSGIYYAPEAETVAEFVEYIRGLPLVPQPEAFGMHDNCNITTAQNEALSLLKGIQEVVAASGGDDSGKSVEDVMDEVAETTQEKMPKLFDLDLCEDRFPTMYSESMNTVFKQECEKFNRLLKIMTASLKDLRKAVKGLIVMTAEIEGVGKSLFTNEQPEMWAKRGPLSLKTLADWTLDLVRRCDFFMDWFNSSKSPVVYWISGFFFPQAFLTAALQNYARKMAFAIDSLTFGFVLEDAIFDPVEEIKEAAEIGCLAYGVYLEGCRWSREDHLLKESEPKILFTELPTVHFKPSQDRQIDPADYNCPLYKVLTRKGTLLTTGHSTNFVMYLELKTTESVDKWILAGVAAFLALRT